MQSELKKNSCLFASNTVFVEEIYQQYLKNPNSVDASWHDLFKSCSDTNANMRPSWGDAPTILNAKVEVPAPAKGAKPTSNLNQLAEKIIEEYRVRGHFLANLDPLGIERPKTKEEIGLDNKALGVKDVDLATETESIFGKKTVAALINHLDTIYAGTVGIECNHLQSFDEIKFLTEAFESRNLANFTKEEKIAILDNLIAAGGMEHYLHVKFPGAKRFSIEGGDATIAAMQEAINHFAKNGVKEVAIGMAHRGRLATLTRVMGKPYRALFAEFAGKSAFDASLGIAGDVKYHMGYNSSRQLFGSDVKIELLPNPSHLEAVNPVVAGKVRAIQDAIGDSERKIVAGIIIHGDAAFSGQGVVGESLAMSYLPPYDVGGILHFVINNQVGFTANAKDCRPSRYSTEIAKMSGSPIFHANGDDAESVIFATRIAIEYRKLFKKDAVIEVVCYRKYGHNEGDEPAYTQPTMYKIIDNKKTPADIYAGALAQGNIIPADGYDSMKAAFKAILDIEFDAAKDYKAKPHAFTGYWEGFERSGPEVDTGFDAKALIKLGLSLCKIPAEFALNPKLKKLFDQRAKELSGGEPLDWAAGEQMAFASLLAEGIPVRITGQDCGRGTFSHRHSVLHDQNNNNKYLPLNHLEGASAKYEVADSFLSEYAVLGFEYGYSIAKPKHLVIWEAQFGDFANGAQIMIDQFIASSETKWMQMSGLVMLLPHGFEGQGPEHSSARLERFLQLCGENNIQVATPTTPASLFHLLRRQVLRNFRKPLIIMSPKSLLRHKLAVSSMADFDKGTKFAPLIDDKLADSKAVKRLVLCAGKVYYDLFEYQVKNNVKDVAIVRLEQLYPFAEAQVKAIVEKYAFAKEIIWCQEEPENMGSWQFIKPYIEKLASGKSLSYIGRKAAASPAVGYMTVHLAEQAEIVKTCMGGA